MDFCDGEIFSLADFAGALLAPCPFGPDPLSDRVGSSPSVPPHRNNSGCCFQVIQGHNHASGTRFSGTEAIATNTKS